MSQDDGVVAVLRECAELLERKGHDYNNGPVKRDDYYIYGRKSLMTMVNTKCLRLRSLIDADTPNFESVEDSLRDLISYAAIWVDWERRHAGE